MPWKRRYTQASIDVDLDEFDEEQLLQGLIDAKWLSEAEAEAILGRARLAEKSPSPFMVAGDPASELETARDYLRRGMRAEARLHLERFLGCDWMGVLQ